MKNNKGFTLIEILITIIIIGLIVISVITISQRVVQTSKNKAQKVFESNLKSSAISYVNEFGNSIVWNPQYIGDTISENEFTCVPVIFLIEKGYLKPSIQMPEDSSVDVSSLKIKVERNTNTKVIVEQSVALDELTCKIVDKTKPNITVTLKDQDGNIYNGTSWTNKNITQYITATDESGINSIRIKYGNKEEQTYNTDNAEILIDYDINTNVTIYAKDNNGNNSETISYNLMIDKGPTSPTITGGSDGWHKSVSITITEPSESLSGISNYEYCVKTTNDSAGCSWQALNNGQVIKNFDTNQDNYVFFRGINTLKDASAPSNSQKIRIDNITPVVSLSGVPNTFVQSTLYQLPTSVTYGSSGGNVVCKYNSVVISNTSSIPSGTYTITCTATSGSGNIGIGSKTVNVTSPCECTYNYQCYTNYSCDGCSCYYDPECYSDTDCGSGYYCSGGTCYKEPTPSCADYHESCTTVSCCSGWRCSASRGICVTPSSGGDSGSGCTCTTKSDCPSGQICSGGYCCTSDGRTCCA